MKTATQVTCERNVTNFIMFSSKLESFPLLLPLQKTLNNAPFIRQHGGVCSQQSAVSRLCLCTQSTASVRYGVACYKLNTTAIMSDIVTKIYSIVKVHSASSTFVCARYDNKRSTYDDNRCVKKNVAAFVIKLICTFFCCCYTDDLRLTLFDRPFASTLWHRVVPPWAMWRVRAAD